MSVDFTDVSSFLRFISRGNADESDVRFILTAEGDAISSSKGSSTGGSGTLSVVVVGCGFHHRSSPSDDDVTSTGTVRWGTGTTYDVPVVCWWEAREPDENALKIRRKTRETDGDRQKIH